MSKAYESFIAQHQSTGTSHGDGYSAAMFSGMSIHERDVAFSMLAAAALDGDATAVDALKHFDSDASMGVLVRVVKSMPSLLAACVAAAILYEFSRDESWISSLVDHLDQGDPLLLWPGIQTIPGRKMEDPAVRTSVARCVEKYLMRDEEAKVLRRVAAKKLLAVYGLDTVDPAGHALVASLTDDQREKRIAALEELIRVCR